MRPKLLALAVGVAALGAPAFAHESMPNRRRSESTPTDWGGWSGGRSRHRSGNNRRVRTSAEAYKAQRRANRLRRKALRK